MIKQLSATIGLVGLLSCAPALQKGNIVLQQQDYSGVITSIAYDCPISCLGMQISFRATIKNGNNTTPFVGYGNHDYDQLKAYKHSQSLVSIECVPKDPCFFHAATIIKREGSS